MQIHTQEKCESSVQEKDYGMGGFGMVFSFMEQIVETLMAYI